MERQNNIRYFFSPPNILCQRNPIFANLKAPGVNSFVFNDLGWYFFSPTHRRSRYYRARTELAPTLRPRRPCAPCSSNWKRSVLGFHQIPVKPFHFMCKRTNESLGFTIRRRRLLLRRQKSNWVDSEIPGKMFKLTAA